MGGHGEADEEHCRCGRPSEQMQRCWDTFNIPRECPRVYYLEHKGVEAMWELASQGAGAGWETPNAKEWCLEEDSPSDVFESGVTGDG